MKGMEQIQTYPMKEKVITDSIGGEQKLIGKYYSKRTMLVKHIESKCAVIINKSEIDHVFLNGDCLILELVDKRRFMFDIKTEDN